MNKNLRLTPKEVDALLKEHEKMKAKNKDLRERLQAIQEIFDTTEKKLETIRRNHSDVKI